MIPFPCWNLGNQLELCVLARFIKKLSKQEKKKEKVKNGITDLTD